MWSAFQSNTGLDLNSAFDALTETVQSVTEQVQEAIPEKHKDFLAKITLNTEEMVAERANFKEEASRKDQTKNILNKILPWETLDPEREVRVRSCSVLCFFCSIQFCFVLFYSVFSFRFDSFRLNS